MVETTLYPNTFQHHNAYIDQVSHFLTGNEEKVLNHIVREIIGFKDNSINRQANIALSVLTDGKISKKTGERLSWGCGLKTDGVRSALATLCEFDLIIKVGKPTRDGQCYGLQLDWDKINWQVMQARKEQQDANYKRQMDEARTKNPRVITLVPSCSTVPLLLNSTPPVEQDPTPPVEQDPTPPVEQDPKNPSSNTLSNPRLDEFFGPKEGAPVLLEERVNLQDEAEREAYLAKLLAGRAAQAESEPWRRTFDWLTHPRQGVERDTLKRVAWVMVQAGIPEPQSDKAQGEWKPALVAIYQESGGDFEIIQTAAQEIIKAGLTYWPPHRWHQQVSTVKAQKIMNQKSYDAPHYADVVVDIPEPGKHIVYIKGVQ